MYSSVEVMFKEIILITEEQQATDEWKTSCNEETHNFYF